MARIKKLVEITREELEAIKKQAFNEGVEKATPTVAYSPKPDFPSVKLLETRFSNDKRVASALDTMRKQKKELQEQLSDITRAIQVVEENPEQYLISLQVAQNTGGNSNLIDIFYPKDFYAGLITPKGV